MNNVKVGVTLSWQNTKRQDVFDTILSLFMQYPILESMDNVENVIRLIVENDFGSFANHFCDVSIPYQ